MARGKISSGSAGDRARRPACAAPAAGWRLRQRQHHRLQQRSPGGEARRRGAGRVQHEAGVDLVGVEGRQLHVQRRLAQLQRHVGMRVRESCSASRGSGAVGDAATRRPAAAARPGRRPRPAPRAAARSASASRRAHRAAAAPRRPGVSATRALRALEQRRRRARAPAAGSPGVSGGCVMCSRCAARLKCSSSATATNWRSVRSSIIRYVSKVSIWHE